MGSLKLQAAMMAALFCLIAAPSIGAAFADEGPGPQPEPFGALENREEAFCRSTGTQNENHCVCSAASVGVPMTFNEWTSYIRLRVPDASTARAIEAKLAQWARYCAPDR